MILTIDKWEIGKDVATSSGWGFAWAVVLGVAVIGVLGYTFYKYRVRVRIYLFSIFIF